MSKIIDVLEPRAMRPHRCSWCFDQVNKGEKYTPQKFSDGGGIYECRFHNECYDAMNKAIEIGSFGRYEDDFELSHGRPRGCPGAPNWDNFGCPCDKKEVAK